MGSGELKEALGANVRLLREARGLSQADLGNMVGTSYSYISNIELAKGNPTIDKVEKLAAALGVRPVELLAGPGGPPPRDDRREPRP